MACIVRLKLARVAQRVERRWGVPLHFDDAVVEQLVQACCLPDAGARNIDSLLDQQILPVLSRAMLARTTGFGSAAPQYLRLGYALQSGIVLEFAEAPGAVA
jgi:type VI secretion system protein VasG